MGSITVEFVIVSLCRGVWLEISAGSDAEAKTRLADLARDLMKEQLVIHNCHLLTITLVQHHQKPHH